jgi:hypothetical protein
MHAGTATTSTLFDPFAIMDVGAGANAYRPFQKSLILLHTCAPLFPVLVLCTATHPSTAFGSHNCSLLHVATRGISYYALAFLMIWQDNYEERDRRSFIKMKPCIHRFHDYKICWKLGLEGSFRIIAPNHMPRN